MEGCAWCCWGLGALTGYGSREVYYSEAYTFVHTVFGQFGGFLEGVVLSIWPRPVRAMVWLQMVRFGWQRLLLSYQEYSIDVDGVDLALVAYNGGCPGVRQFTQAVNAQVDHLVFFSANGFDQYSL